MSQATQEQKHPLIIDDQRYRIDDPFVSGRQLLSIASKVPASDYTIIAAIDKGTRSVGLDETFDIAAQSLPKFHTFKGDRIFRAIINEREVVWGSGEISAHQLRTIGEVPPDQDLFFDSNRDRAIEDDANLSLKPSGVERFRSGDPLDDNVDVILNGEITTIEKGRLSFTELARLAFPKLVGGTQVCFTISFSRGPKRRCEGVLLEGNKIRIVEGMVFNVSATDKS